MLCSVLALNNASSVSSHSCHTSKWRPTSAKLSKQCRRPISTTNANYCGKFVTNPSDLVSQEQADELIRRLRKEEINLLKTAIEHYDSHADKADFEGKLGFMEAQQDAGHDSILHLYRPLI